MPSASSTSDAVTDAVAALAGGGVVVFPTETVYGVGADAGDAAAVERIFELKGRPRQRAVTVHLATAGDAAAWAGEMGPEAEALAGALWPGPLTIVVPAADHVLDVVRGGGLNVGLRVPDHPVAQALLAGFGRGIVGTSANPHGDPPATTLDAARAAVPGADAYLDGGPCEFGVGSTVVDLSGDAPTVLREGAISPAQLAEILGRDVRVGTGG